MDAANSSHAHPDTVDAPADPELVALFVEEALEIVAKLETALLGLDEAADPGGRVRRAFGYAHTLKGNSALVGLADITAHCHALESVLGGLRDGTLAATRRVVDALLGGLDVLTLLLDAAPGEVDAALHARRLASLASLADGGSPRPAIGPLADPPGDTAFAPGAHDVPNPSSLRVATEKIDALVNLAGELAVTQSMVAQLVSQFTPDKLPQLQEAVQETQRHARELQERALGIRMLPIRTLFSRLPRLVRDCSAQCGKAVELRLVGEETELDKSVLEQLADPLLHLVRNAIDHGLEDPATRTAAGKPRQGTLTVSAAQHGGNLRVEVIDDGRGLDRAAIFAQAVAAGLLPADAAPLDEDLLGLVCHPGLSTAARVTDISGRGVGMDVVQRAIHALGGVLRISSAAGGGTTFRVVLPLTLAMLEGQLLEVGGHVYVLPLGAIVESLRPSPSDVHRVLGRGELLQLRGEMVPILPLWRVLDHTPARPDPHPELLVVADSERGRVALVIDRLLAQQQVVIKSLDHNFQRVEGIAGATILGDGRVALIIDVAGLIATDRRRGAPAPMPSAAAAPARHGAPHATPRAPTLAHRLENR